MSRAIARARLTHQLLIGARAATPLQVVRTLGAVQAQDYAHALWAVGIRLAGATLDRVERAVEERQLIRTWPMRGTLHLVPAEDVRWLLALTGVRALPASTRRMQQLGLDAQTLAAAERIVVRALEGGVCLPRNELLARLTRAGIAVEAERGSQLLLRLALHGVVCFGPARGKQPSVVLLHEWAKEQRPLAPDEALTTLAQRYFTSRAPATLSDFAWWSGLTLGHAKRALAALAPRLVLRDGHVLDSERSPARANSAALLLPAFDEYLLGYRDRSAVVAEHDAAQLVPGKNGIFLPMVVVDGSIVGTWSRVLTKTQAQITVKTFRNLPAAAHAKIARAAQRYGKFLGLPVAR